MAFFKFRWPGQTEQAPAEKPNRRSRTPQAESIEVMRRRARHRLIGAAVLVLVGVIGFPMLFDTQPRPIPVDIPIEIPDRNKVAPLVVPGPVAEAPVARAPTVPDAPAAAQRPAPARSNVAGNNGLTEGEELVQGSRPAAPKPSAPPPQRPSQKSSLSPNPCQRLNINRRRNPTMPPEPAHCWKAVRPPTLVLQPLPRPRTADSSSRSALLQMQTRPGKHVPRWNAQA